MEINIDQLGYNYYLGTSKNPKEIQIIKDCTWLFKSGTFTSIRGSSGSGKSTLLSLIGLMDCPSTGEIAFDGKLVGRLSDSTQSKIRAKQIGFLFQDFRLVKSMTVFENIILALEISHGKSVNNLTKTKQILEKVDLSNRGLHYPAELSGGEMQRVALCRAIVKSPDLLLMDEPTGNLDAFNREIVMSIVSEFNKQGGTVLMVTHDEDTASCAKNHVVLTNGVITSERSHISK
ncbi:ABC transporter ATP-binding protein (plasmid) [Deinococcus taeanensis]|uniref:ABC transporter ATP-binding protein n=1 Tax=Deinococcus taeanensis TaxID=2737050 RepID=UPI001CDBACBC|nr:ABC transporter ATP-binding protein [Deinococcus taeanensis]UBV44641.1 ABC transporter ATP-binding protein [Deinococcus taeanensis]